MIQILAVTLLLELLWRSRKIACFLFSDFFLERTTSNDFPLLTTKDHPRLIYHLTSTHSLEIGFMWWVPSASAVQTLWVRLNKPWDWMKERKEKIKSCFCPVSWYFELPQLTHTAHNKVWASSLSLSCSHAYVHTHTERLLDLTCFASPNQVPTWHLVPKSL